MGRKTYSIEFKKEVCEFYQTHKMVETCAKFGIAPANVSKWVKALGYPAKRRGKPVTDNDIRHDACHYYENHTGADTCAKFGISHATLMQWRRTLGYRNKHFNYNLYMQDMQPVVQTQQRRDFLVTRDENGKLRADLAEITQKYVQLEQEFTQFKSKIMEALQ